jgi:hypothetical protein
VAVVAQPTLAAVELRSILPRAVLVAAVQVLSSQGLQQVLLARLGRVTLVVRVRILQSMPTCKRAAAGAARVQRARLDREPRMAVQVPHLQSLVHL